VLFLFLTVGLNMIFIPIYGILGSAFATLLSITLYSLAKLMFVVKGCTYFLLLNKRYILWVCHFILLFYFLVFFIPIVAIGLKSILVTLAYTYINYKFVISIEINEVIDTVRN
jgi:O-antigen/teichoic acid export membrane protein